MGQKHKRFGNFGRHFQCATSAKILAAMSTRVPQAMAQFVLKIEKLSHIMGPTPILEMARAYGLRPRLWLLLTCACLERRHFFPRKNHIWKYFSGLWRDFLNNTNNTFCIKTCQLISNQWNFTSATLNHIRFISKITTEK